MFVDEVTVKIKAGDGGNGCIAFRREKYVEFGGPYGGNGGKGSDIIFKVDEGLSTLIDLRYQKEVKGKKGANGLGKGKHGKKAEDVIIKVPLGTVITDLDTDLIIADLTQNNDSVVIAEGGRGGRGNIAFATGNNPAPSLAENGEPGEERNIKVEIKLLADVGLVGMPSVGKSTIISKISAAKPKIASYHFTTLKPNLGVVETKSKNAFVVADLPGLIKGASLGEGLGDRFLRHIERTRIIGHVIDMSGLEGRDPYQDYLTINQELKEYNESLIKKPQIIIANKMDLEIAKENLKRFQQKVKLPVITISAIKGEGLETLIEQLAEMLKKIERKPLYQEEKFESHVIYKFKEEKPFEIKNQNGVWVITGKHIEKLVKMTKFSGDEAMTRFSYRIRKLGIDNKLRELGAKEGDIVRILDFEFEYTD